jgi:biotin carboxyl carrier protein
MKLEIELGGIAHTTELTWSEGKLRATIDGKTIDADAVEISRGIYSIVIGGRSREVRVERFGTGLRITSGGSEYSAQVRDPRKWERNRGAAISAQGRQNVVAPMPGRVVRVLVTAGDHVDAGQGLVVVEAMKMQNEVRSPKAGAVERLLVKEGQAVNPGDTIAVIS